MSSHQCCLRGSLDIKPDATDELIATALEPFLEAYGLDYNRELVSGAIEILDNRRQLTLSLEFQGDGGGYINIGIDETIGRLNRLVDGHGYLEMVDYDTAATESMVTPFFVGAELRARNRARIHYAIDQATPWLESTLEAGAVRQIRDYILSFQPRGTPCTSLPAGESMRRDPALPAMPHSLTPSQVTILKSFADGDFANLLACPDEEAFRVELDQCGDDLLKFLIAETSRREDCHSLGETIDRIDAAILDLDKARDAVAMDQEWSVDEPVESHSSRSPTLDPSVERTAQFKQMATEAGLTGTVLEDIYIPAGDGEHPVFSRAMWREAVAKQDTASGYRDWTAHQIAEATEPAQG